ALLNTIAATATASYITGHMASVHGPADAKVLQAQAMVHGQSIGFYVAAAILAGVALVAGLLINVRRPIGDAHESEPVAVAAG
ncbi:MAG TPA: MFS transporter, partial [Gordonia polyisoprenivorans]|nr:MFS transporter [Gordonia polyisoprenivorans]